MLSEAQHTYTLKFRQTSTTSLVGLIELEFSEQKKVCVVVSNYLAVDEKEKWNPCTLIERNS